MFYRSSAEAERAGFRACLRCRPDLAPNSVQWRGTAAVVGRALTMISQGDVDEISMEVLAGKLGISDRHLRRLFDEHVGASPLEVAISKRLHLAKHLLTQSNLPVTEVAFASGYKSLRRFNEAFRHRFKVSPTTFRRSTSPGQGPALTQGLTPESRANFIRVAVPVIAPYDWDHIFAFLRDHAVEGVEGFRNGQYRRVFAAGDTVGTIEVGFDPKNAQLRAGISISDPAGLRTVIERVRDLFDARVNPHAHLNDLCSTDPVALCYRRALGLRIPGSWDTFETAVCIILGQLVSVDQARQTVRKLVEQFGRRVRSPIFAECAVVFPCAQTLANANLKNVGITRVREHAIRELARLVAEGQLDLSRSSDIERTRSQLLSIRGFGPWTVEMIAMRCLGDANAFPKSDLIIRRALNIHNYDSKEGDWSPWNAYITLALWKRYASELSRKRRMSPT